MVPHSIVRPQDQWVSAPYRASPPMQPSGGHSSGGKVYVACALALPFAPRAVSDCAPVKTGATYWSFGFLFIWAYGHKYSVIWFLFIQSFGVGSAIKESKSTC